MRNGMKGFLQLGLIGATVLFLTACQQPNVREVFKEHANMPSSFEEPTAENIWDGAGTDVEAKVSFRGYGSDGSVKTDPYIEDPGFELENVAKSDTDMIAEMHLNQSLIELRTLMSKLYKRNPNEFRKSYANSIPERQRQIFNDHDFSDLPGLDGARDIEAMRLAFDPNFRGDRVLALVGGTADMLMKSYGYKSEFFITDELNPQSLYNAARNIEIAVWRLSNTYTDDGRPLLLTNSGPDEPIANLSFERLFGKLIGRQDMIAHIVDNKSDRAIKAVIQSIASALFIPIPVP